MRAPLSLKVDVYREPNVIKLDILKAELVSIFGEGVMTWQFDEDDVTWKLLDADGRKLVQISGSDDYKEVLG